MSIEEDILIERYLNDNLSEQELKDFLVRLRTDIEFSERVTFERQLKASFNEDSWSSIDENTESELIDAYKEVYRSNDIRVLEQELNHATTKYKTSKKTKIFRLMLYASAAVIALLVVLNTFSSAYTSNELYGEMLDLNRLSSFISRENANENELVKAQLLFEEEAYEKAAAIFEKELIALESSEDANIYLYLGISQMEIDDFENSEITFNKLISSNLIDAEKGKWYKALLFLKMERIEDCKKLLEEIITLNSYNSDKAKKLYGKLSKLKTP